MITLIDNYDSFTYNLVQYIGNLGRECSVIRNDKKNVAEILKDSPEYIVLSPGPSDPDHAGVCLDLIGAATDHGIPLLGVCLGHQSIGQYFGGKVIRAPQPMHGKISSISHSGTGLFSGIPSPFSVTRYHSLIVEKESLPDCLEITAETEDGLIMGLSHKTKPIHGVQFHPESIATQYGLDLLSNFFTIAKL
ncbi:MAG: aminodeoxychorismate/anthranilate synthase component II [Alphaproteobacteria bacterium]|nr:aminodeoxychorismate/anthranilate synthase component II [Alphaproteobacteria bacterium]